MFHYLKQHRTLFCIINYLVKQNQRLSTGASAFAPSLNYSTQIGLFGVIQNKSLLISNDQSRLILSRNKSVKRKTGYNKYGKDDGESSDEDEDELEGEDDETLNEGSNVKTFSCKSLRFDLILKVALGISRKKIEESFYQNKIRINGSKILKKSENVKEGDEIDIIKSLGKSENEVIIGRVKIIAVEPNQEGGNHLVKILKTKSQKINNYQNGDNLQDFRKEE